MPVDRPRRHRNERDARHNVAGTDIRIERQVASFIWKYWDAFQERRERQKLRAAWSNLSDRDLMDIGITRGEIDYVAFNRSADPRAVRPTEWFRYWPMVDGQMGPFETHQYPEVDFR